MTDKLKEHTAAMVGENTVDLLALDTAVAMSQSAACHIINPLTKQETGAKIYLFGSDSERVQNYINGEANAQLRREADLRARGKTPEAPTVEKAIDRAIELLIVATDRWEGVSFGGETNVTFTVAKARELYKVKFIREQLQEFMGEIENFMKG